MSELRAVKAAPSTCEHPPVAGRIITTCLLLALAGCSGNPRTYPAGGTITLVDGTPLAGARISFQLADDNTAPTAGGTVQADGSFALQTFADGDGALPGEHQVMIVPPPSPRRPGWERDVTAGGGRQQSSAPQMDSRYRSFATSGLTYTVTGDAAQNQFQIQLDVAR